MMPPGGGEADLIFAGAGLSLSKVGECIVDEAVFAQYPPDGGGNYTDHSASASVEFWQSEKIARTK
jgi:hypothetical protein